jgi:hypothetical protein
VSPPEAPPTGDHRPHEHCERRSDPLVTPPRVRDDLAGTPTATPLTTIHAVSDDSRATTVQVRCD